MGLAAPQEHVELGLAPPPPQTCQAWGRVLAWDMAHGLRACPQFLVLLLSRHCQCKEAEAVLSGHREGRGQAKLSQGVLCSAAAARYKPTSRLTKQSWALFCLMLSILGKNKQSSHFQSKVPGLKAAERQDAF